jgi:hypothetical protein
MGSKKRLATCKHPLCKKVTPFGNAESCLNYAPGGGFCQAGSDSIAENNVSAGFVRISGKSLPSPNKPEAFFVGRDALR